MVQIKKILLTIILFGFSTLCAQKPDSLRNLINSDAHDTIKVQALNDLAKIIIRKNPKNALDTLNLAIKLADKARFPKGKALALKTKGFVYFIEGNADSTLHYFKQSLKIFEENGFIAQAGRMYNNIGIMYARKGNIHDAIKAYNTAIKLLVQTSDISSLISTYINLAPRYRNIGDFQKALEINFKALKTFDKLPRITSGDSIKIAHIYKSIANIYASQNNFSDAETYYKKALEIYKRYKSTRNIADVYLNMGYLFSKTPKKEKLFYQKALKLYKSPDRQALSHLNLADVYNRLHLYDSAKLHLDTALLLYKKLQDKRGLVQCYTLYGEFYSKQNKFVKATQILQQAFDSAQSIGDINIIENVAKSLYNAYKHTGDYKNALKFHELYQQAHDSIFNTNNEKKLTRLSLTYQFEKEKAEQEIQFQEQLKRQKIIKNFTFAILFFVLLTLIAVFMAFLTKKRKNIELQEKNAEILQQKEEIIAQRDEIEKHLEYIENQKHQIEQQAKEIENQRDLAIKRGNELEKKNKNIKASIYYAQRIQEALLPAHDIFKTEFSEYFIFYKPRDIVSGDFYWITKTKDKVIVTAADCTGHGVPGAFMSLLGITYLNSIVKEQGITKANLILENLRKKIITSLKQDSEDFNSSRDGMDMSLIVYDKTNSEIEFSGAYNPLIIITKQQKQFSDAKKVRSLQDKISDKILYQIKADRMPLGIHLLKNGNFSVVSFSTSPNDCLYMFSDGFIDLFDEQQKNKYSLRRFKNLLLSIADKPMDKQKLQIEQEFLTWKGKSKQIDDILIIGLRI